MNCTQLNNCEVMNLLLRQICKYKQKLSNFKWGIKNHSIYYIEHHYLTQRMTMYSTVFGQRELYTKLQSLYFYS